MEVARQPKRRNLVETKMRILESAADVFTGSGYARASLREIAERAGVAASLVSKHFGTKGSLFREALVHVVRTNSVFTSEKAEFGRTMARLIGEGSNTQITVMLVLALADPEAKEIARQVSREEMIAPLAEWLGPPNAVERAMELFALLTGFVIQMKGLHAAPIPVASSSWLAELLQAMVDGDPQPISSHTAATGCP
jgi:AcrR family transcriptional regulator